MTATICGHNWTLSTVERMSPADRYHQTLRLGCVVIATVNASLWLTPGIREFLVYFDPWFVMTILPLTYVLGLGSVPYLMPREQQTSTSARYLVILVLVSILLIGYEFFFVNVVAVGTFFRGPDWNFYWPWEERIPKIVPINYVDLSEYVWIHLREQKRPANFLLRELPGLAFLFLYFVIIPVLLFRLMRLGGSRLSAGRLLLLLFMFQLMAFPPIKIGLRLFFNLKYIVWSADHFLNI